MPDPLAPQEPGDPADHLAELQLYWPHPCAEAWALDLNASSGGELEDLLPDRLGANIVDVRTDRPRDST